MSATPHYIGHNDLAQPPYALELANEACVTAKILHSLTPLRSFSVF